MDESSGRAVQLYESRQRAFGESLRVARSACRAARLRNSRPVASSICPRRAHPANFAFLGGASPNYADYMVLAALQWVVSVSTPPVLAAGDELLRAWFTRSLDLYGGLGRDARMRPLFE